jgi:hypothetical protein
MTVGESGIKILSLVMAGLDPAQAATHPRVIASEAKQSRSSSARSNLEGERGLDCVVACAPRNDGGDNGLARDYRD